MTSARPPLRGQVAALIAEVLDAERATMSAQRLALAQRRAEVQDELNAVFTGPPEDQLDRTIVEAGLRRRLKAIIDAEDSVREKEAFLRRRLDPGGPAVSAF